MQLVGRTRWVPLQNMCVGWWAVALSEVGSYCKCGLSELHEVGTHTLEGLDQKALPKGQPCTRPTASSRIPGLSTSQSWLHWISGNSATGCASQSSQTMGSGARLETQESQQCFWKAHLPFSRGLHHCAGSESQFCPSCAVCMWASLASVSSSVKSGCPQ